VKQRLHLQLYIETGGVGDTREGLKVYYYGTPLLQTFKDPKVLDTFCCNLEDLLFHWYKIS